MTKLQICISFILPCICRYNESVFEMCSPKFWSFFLSLHRFSTGAIDAALGAAKKNFLCKRTVGEVQAQWRNIRHGGTVHLYGMGVLLRTNERVSGPDIQGLPKGIFTVQYTNPPLKTQIRLYKTQIHFE